VKRCGVGRLLRYSRNLFSGDWETGTAGSDIAIQLQRQSKAGAEKKERDEQ
jgi:hypothetical protein